MNMEQADGVTVDKATGEKSFTLPSGKQAVIKVGKGKHGRIAMGLAEGDGGKYLAALMSQLILIDGQPIVMEDLDEIPLQDYMAIQAEFADQNFTSPQGT